jgi:hypothetical protein
MISQHINSSKIYLATKSAKLYVFIFNRKEHKVWRKAHENL